ncbi:MAG: efflux RND transporter periplasmic adaptor subunit [Proteobacteria bacterium]|nr:efflux RND transporter periplasmic adaptor subunit [Pseudomonadota bacterium]
MKRTIFFLPVLVAASLFLSACGSEPANSDRKHSAYTPETTVQAERAMLPRLHEAVGTIRAQTDIRVESQVTGRVLKVLVRPGQQVTAGEELVVLDNRASQAQVERSQQARQSVVSMTAQAGSALEAAKASFAKAESTYKRMKQLHDENVVTPEEVEKAEAAYLQAQAWLNQAREGVAAAQARGREAAQVVQEAEIGLDYTTITAQVDGEVAKRLVEPGDLAFPGKELLTLQTGASLRIEALVRESLINLVRLGDRLGVVVSAMTNDAPLFAIVDEIEPLADPVTRSFLVKARLPEVPDLYPGMFGRLLISQGERESVLVPERAVSRVGQLETVMVQTGETWQPVYVRTGPLHGDKIEVLSGLSGDETIGLGVLTEAVQ